MPDFENKRSHRVAQLIQEELAQLIANDIKDPRVGFVTVTEVRLADDLKNGRVYVSVYGGEKERAASLAGLAKAAGFLRRELSRRLKLRHTPDLAFFCDDTLDKAQRLQEIMIAIKQGETDIPEHHTTAPLPVQTQRKALAARALLFAQTNKKKSRRPKR